MKKYFDFYLTGRHLFPIWIILYIVFVIPYIILIGMTESLKNDQVNLLVSIVVFLFMILLIFIAAIWSYYFIRANYGGVVYNDKQVKCEYNFGEYMMIVVSGFLLTVITLGIYLPWYCTNLQKYFIDNSSYNGEKFSFMGNGKVLFIITLASLILPLFLLTAFVATELKPELYRFREMPVYRIIYQIIVYFVLIPNMYLTYKWIVNIKYKNYHIRWNTIFWPSAGKIAKEMFFSVITIGIYAPLAVLKLYKYFMDRTEAKSINAGGYRFGFEIVPKDDFLMLWGQILLSIITLGLYYPWAICKISKRILNRTYLERNTEVISIN